MICRYREIYYPLRRINSRICSVWTGRLFYGMFGRLSAVLPSRAPTMWLVISTGVEIRVLAFGDQRVPESLHLL